MKKLILPLALAFLMGCSQQTAENVEPKPVEYTNLIDETSQNELKTLLSDVGISDETASEYFVLVNDFNARIEDISTLSEGYLAIDTLDYSNVFLTTVNTYETNCRLATFELTKDFMSTDIARDFNDTFLMFDEDALLHDPIYIEEQHEIDAFMNYFGTVDISGLQTTDEHISAIKTYLESANVDVNLPDNMSIINIYLHSTFDDFRFVGHTGVLFETEDGLVFLEKFSPYLPFQMTNFNTREELSDYLASRPDLIAEADELDTIIFENFDLMLAK